MQKDTEIVQVLKTALNESSKIAKRSFDNISSVQIKESQSSILTKTDLESEKKLISIIQKKYPTHSILSEECGLIKKDSEYTWVLDPIDGTSNFAAGLPWYCIIICVFRKDEPVHAGVYFPFYDDMYLASKGKGATKNGKKISVTKQRKLSNVLVAYSLQYHKSFAFTKKEASIIAKLVKNSRNTRSINTGCELCYCAEGKLGASMNQCMKIWDVAAPQLIIEEAGGIVTNFKGQKHKYDFGKKIFQNYPSVCASKAIHRQIMRLL